MPRPLHSDELPGEPLAGSVLGDQPEHDFAPYSVTLLRLKVSSTESSSADLDQPLLERIAQASRCGKYTYVKASADLQNIYIRLRHESTGTVIGEFSGQIQQGQTVDVGRVDVPTGRQDMKMSLAWPGSRLELIARDPTGRVIKEGDSDVSLNRYPRLVYLIVRNPMAGVWQLQAVGAEVPEAQLTYAAVVSVGQPLPPSPTPKPQPTPTTIPTRTVTARPTLVPTPSATPVVPASSGGSGLGLILGLAGLVGAVMVVVTVARRNRQEDGAARGVTARLVGLTGQGAFTVWDGAVLGRGEGCAIQLLDPAASRRHAQFCYAQGTWYIQDLGSKGGTYVNGNPVKATALRDGDRVRAGETEFEFRGGG